MAIASPSQEHAGVLRVTKPEWGTKRICQSCGARFYDMRHSPIVCPKCATVFDPELLVKARRPRPPTPPVVPVPVPIPDPEAAEVDETAAAELAEVEEDDVIEDASELGEDEDDVAEVIENVTEEEGER
jgi:uncharacterized protein (TIGR02300 family)